MITSGTITPAIRVTSIVVALLLHAVPLLCLFAPPSAELELPQPAVTRIHLLPPPPPPPPVAEPEPVVEKRPERPPAPPPPIVQTESKVAVPPPPPEPPKEEIAPPEPPPPEPPPPEPEPEPAPLPEAPPMPPEKKEEPKPMPPKKEPKAPEPETPPPVKPAEPPPEPVNPAPPVETPPSVPPPAPARLDDVVSDGRPGEEPILRQSITPVYPLSARRKGLEGPVTCLVHVTERGRADRVEVVRSSGHPVLDEAALRAIRKARFIPAKRNGKKIASETRLTFVFRLEDGR